MKILFISPMLPYPPDNGGKIRTFNLIKNLSRMHEVTLLCFVWKRTGETGFMEELRGYCADFVPVVMEMGFTARIRTKLKHFINLFTGTPWVVEYHNSPEMRDKIKELAGGNRFDLVHIEVGYMGQYASAAGGLPVILDEQNIEWMLALKIGRTAGSFLKRSYYAREGKKMLEWEKRMLKNISRRIVVSENDRRLVESSGYAAPTSVVPNGVDTGLFRPEGVFKDAPPDLLLVGSMKWFPNRDSAEYFLKDIFPKLRETHPSLKLYMAGEGTDRIFKEFSGDGNLIFAGYVNDILPYFRKNVILAVPLRVGEGTRFKILEAMASGVPVVSTTIGCEGINVESGRNILVADNPGDFADAISRLIKDAGLRRKLSEEARKMAESCYGWGNIIKGLNEIYLKTIKQRD